MISDPRDPQANLPLADSGQPGDALTGGLLIWGRRWLPVFARQTPLTQVWIAQVNEHLGVHWLVTSGSESLPKQFSPRAMETVIRTQHPFTFKNHVELVSGGLFPVVQSCQIVGLLGLLSNHTDYFNAANLAWIRTLTHLDLDGWPQDRLGFSPGEVERSISRSLQSSLDIRGVLPSILEMLTAALEADAATFLRYRPSTRRFELLDSQGLEKTVLAKLNLGLETGVSGKSSFDDGQAVWIEDLQELPLNLRLINRLDEEGYRGYVIQPLRAHNDLVGALEIAWRIPQAPRYDYITLLERAADQIALALERSEIFSDMRHSNVELATKYNSMIEGLSRALELRDLETDGHTRRVSALTMRLVEYMHIPRGHWDAIQQGALLHDIGKIGIPDAILLKPGSLNAQEKKVMQQHVLYGYNVLAPIMNLRNTLDIVLYHHERWDGRGYLHGLKGEQIPLVARLFSVVDVYDALTSDRPYRPAWPVIQALNYLKAEAGRQFDPQVVKSFLEIIERKV